MLRRTPTLVVTAVAAGAALAGCGGVAIGTGDLVTQDREISAVTAVTLATAGRLTVSTGDEPGLTVTAGEQVIDRLTSEVHDGVLVLDLPGRWVNLGPVDYDLVLPRVDRIAVDGAGDVRGEVAPTDAFELTIDGAADVDLDGLDVDDLTVRIDGTGTVTLTGTADSQDVRLDGAGSYSAADLETREAVVALAGVGEVEVHVTELLDAQIDGAGRIGYRGDPEVTRSIDGVGSISGG